MTVKDGFKFGIGFAIGMGLLRLPSEYLDKKSRLRKECDRLVRMIKDPESSTYDGTEPAKNKIGFTID